MSHDSYDLFAATPISRAASFGELLAQGEDELGEPVALDLEHDVITAFDCPACGQHESAAVLLDRATAGSALCPSCGAERTFEVRHHIDAGDAELLALSPEDFDLPPADVVTARASQARIHFVLDDPHPWEFVEAAVAEEASR